MRFLKLLAALTVFVVAMALMSLGSDEDNWLRGFWLGVNPLLMVWFFIGLFWLGKRLASHL